MRFEFATAGRIVFGPGTLQEAGPAARALGRKPLLVTGRDAGRCEPLKALLEAQGMVVEVLGSGGEPTVQAATRGAARARELGCDVVLAMGGGSALDLGKAIAALATNPGDPLQYLEVIGAGRPLTERPLPFIALPTTAGTGAEVTRNAVLTSTEHGVKVSLRHPWMLPSLAIVDPLLTHDLPRELTASTGMDALTQLIEPYVSLKANPIADAFCLEGIRRSVRSLRRACADGGDASAREDLALASLLGGLALANAGLGAVHGLAAPLGGLRPVPHGVACAALLPHVWGLNVTMLRAQTEHPALARFEAIARILTGHPGARAEDGTAWLSDLAAELGIPKLSSFGLTEAEIPAVAFGAAKASSMQANPVRLGEPDLEALLRKVL